jgi:predicted permease
LRLARLNEKIQARTPIEGMEIIGTAVHHLDSLHSDAIFGWRQILKQKTVSMAAVVSLALGIGASLAAFRLIDALFLRALPVAHPEQLYVLTYQNYFDGAIDRRDQFDYPGFHVMRSAVQDRAELIAIGFANRIDLTFSSDSEIERAWRQYVSGWMFRAFGLKPALGRLLTGNDDVSPGAHPYAVISFEYWSRRFAKDPRVIGRRFRIGNDVFEIIGVAPQGFTGTDPGTFTDIYLPNMMNVPSISTASTTYRVWLVPRPGASLAGTRERLRAALHSYREVAVKSAPQVQSKAARDVFLAATVFLEPAARGRSYLQTGSLRRVLPLFAVLVALVLLIACGNVANLMSAQAAARTREIALRIAIGAGRARLIQLVLIECAALAFSASLLGLAFSAWAAPFVAGRLNPPDQPIRLALEAGWRVAGFALSLACAVILLFGLAPALRVSSTKPISVLKGGDPPRARRLSIHMGSAVQAAFCAFVLFVAGLFISTFQTMANQPTGFSSERLLTLESVSKEQLPTALWYRAVGDMEALPGVESAALAEYALMSFNAQTGFVWANGHVPDGTWANSTWFLGVSPGWFQTMGIALLDGRDFRPNDEFPRVAVVNRKFAKRYFGNESPLGRSFETVSSGGFSRSAGANGRVSVRIIGVVGDARYEDMRLPVPATAYLPFRALQSRTEKGDRATFLVRMKTRNPMAFASTLRRKIQAAHPEIRIANIVPQEELVSVQMIRERLLASLSLFFAAVALVLAAVGLYSVLNQAVAQRRRELGIRLALGARARAVATLVAARPLALIVLGSALGLELGLISERYFATLLYQVKGSDPYMLALPAITLLSAAALAAIPPALRAIRLDPAALLRDE